MTVEQLLHNTTSAELSEWRAFLQIEQERDQPQENLTEEDAWRKAFNAYG